MTFKELSISGAYRYQSGLPGPRVLCFGGIHGDEPCGVWAIQKLMDDVKTGAIKPLGGTITLVVANEEALMKNVRYIDENLNRLFQDSAIKESDHYERRRAAELMPLIKETEFFLDLHSTSSPTEPFITCEAKYLELAKKLAVKNIVVGWGDLSSKITLGDTETYAVRNGVTAFTFECGAHNDESSKKVAYETLLQFLGFAGILTEVPRSLTETIEYRLFHVEDCKDVSFKFVKHFHNFSSLEKGEIIGHDSIREHTAPSDCSLVLPAYRNTRRIGEELYYLAHVNSK